VSNAGLYADYTRVVLLHSGGKPTYDSAASWRGISGCVTISASEAMPGFKLILPRRGVAY